MELFCYQREPFYIQFSLAFSKPSMTQYVKRSLLFILVFCFFTAHSQENIKQTSVTGNELANSPEVKLLTKANFFRRTDKSVSSKFAHEALQISKESKNHQISAQAHSLLGELAQESKNINQSIDHFLQASLTYKKMDDKLNQIKFSVKYIKLFFEDKRYNEADKKIDELLSTEQKYGDRFSIAKILILKADGYYQQKRYNDAITQYSHSIKYLSNQDNVEHKQLAKTYHQIAQSYKYLNNRDQAIIFYKKALNVYAILQDQSSIGRSLNNLAKEERKLGNYVSALDYSLRGVEIQKQLGDPKHLAKALMGAGIIYRYIGRFEKSLVHIHEAHRYYKKINDNSNIAETSNQMGLIYTRLREFDQAKSFYQLTINLPENTVRANSRAAALRETAVIDLKAHKYDSAMVMAKQAHRIYQGQNDKLKSSITARVIGNIYSAQKNEVQTIAFYRQSLSLAIEVDDKKHQIKSLNNLGRSLITKNTDEALELLKESLRLSTLIQMKEETLSTYHSLRIAEKLKGNIAQALHYSEEENALSAIIQNEKDKNKLVLAKATIYSHKLEMELESLREKTKLDQLALAKKNSEIEIAGQARLISELELTKNQYASFALASLLAICLLAVIFITRRFFHSSKHNKELHKLAARDPLTNSYNRRVLDNIMNQDFTNLALLGEYCIILTDIDHFKAVNDNHGHNTGDAVICGVANILQDGVRQNDVVARFGGEEFCIILPETTQSQAMQIAESLRQKIENARFKEIAVTCSFGVTSIKFDAKSPTELIDQADLALYKSKNSGRNHVTIWEQTFAGIRGNSKE